MTVVARILRTAFQSSSFGTDHTRLTDHRRMTMDLPPWERFIPFILLYYAPVMIGAYRTRFPRRSG